MNQVDILVNKLLREFSHNPKEIERATWIIVHEYIHGVRPTEYDIREIDENLYLNVLKEFKDKLNHEINDN